MTPGIVNCPVADAFEDEEYENPSRLSFVVWLVIALRRRVKIQ